MAPRPHFEYDSDEFYEEIFSAAFQGLTDAEIADALAEKFGTALDPDTFSAMKNGRYIGWSAEENARRGDRILRVLSRGRRKTNSIVRGAYLKAALGGRKLRNKSVTTRKIRMQDGTETGEEDIQTTETETELPPNMQALATWLHHHDKEWRDAEEGRDVLADIPTDVDRGVDISAWIRKEVGADDKDTRGV